MLCAHCHTKNPTRARFCLGCGAALLAVDLCPVCQAPVIPGAGYCYRCGSALKESIPSQEAQLSRYIPKELLARLTAAHAGRAMEGERRIVTMLFCDVKGSTAMAEKLDPEDWAGIMNGAFEYLIRPIYRYEGILARLMGDAILAFFGAPIAHEDDPQRAVLAGLEIVDGIGEYRELVWARWGIPIDVRVGINTGLVVVGEVGSDLRVEYTAMGDAVNLAARMEQTAQAGSVQIAGQTYQQVAPFFEFAPAQQIEVKGKSRPVTAYQVLRAKSRPGRLRGLAGLSAPVIGRDGELAVITKALSDLRHGRGQIICLIGEAGLGKSRLIAEMRSLWAGAWQETTCASYTAAHPYAAYQQYLRSVCEIDRADPPETISVKLRSALGAGGHEWLSGVLPVFEAVLGIQHAGGESLEGEALQRRLYEAALGIGRLRSASGPHVIVFDDTHWIDPATADLLIHLFQMARDTPTCFLCASRPDTASPGWRLVEHARRDLSDIYTEITLEPLTEAGGQALVDDLLGEQPSALSRRILQRAEGNPLFIEEVIRSLMDSQGLVHEDGRWRLTSDAAAASIPDNLRALLIARIDRLPEDTRRVLQLAAVIGRRFPEALLTGIAGDANLEASLSSLEHLDLIQPVVDARTPEYAFRHALIHEAAYSSILLRRRRELHQRIGETLEGQRPEPDPALLGFHFFEAQDYPRAQTYYSDAGDAAARLYANAEAAQHYAKAVEAAGKAGRSPRVMGDLFLRRAAVQTLAADYDGALATYGELKTLAGDRDDQRLLLDALMAEGTIRSTPTPVYDALVGEQLSERALVLAKSFGDREAEAKILWNLMLLSSFTDEPGRVVEYGEQALGIVRQLGLKEQAAFILNDLNRAYRAVGDLSRSRAVLDESRAMWRELGNLPMLTDNLGSSSYLYLMMGDLDTALACGEEGYRVSLQTDNLWGQAFNRSGMAYVQFGRGHIQDALDGMREAVLIAERFMMPLGQAGVGADLAWMHTTLGQVDQGLALADKAVAVLRGSHLPPVIHAWAWSAVARARLSAGDLPGAEAALAQIPPGAGSDEPGTHAPVYAALVRGDLLLARGDAAQALALNSAIEAKVRGWLAEGDLPEVLWHKGRILNALNRPREARQALDEGQRLARAQSARWLLLNILIEKSRAEKQLGSLAVAARLERQAARTAQFIGGKIQDVSARKAFWRQIPVLSGQPDQ